MVQGSDGKLRNIRECNHANTKSIIKTDLPPNVIRGDYQEEENINDDLDSDYDAPMSSPPNYHKEVKGLDKAIQLMQNTFSKPMKAASFQLGQNNFFSVQSRRKADTYCDHNADHTGSNANNSNAAVDDNQTNDNQTNDNQTYDYQTDDNHLDGNAVNEFVIPDLNQNVFIAQRSTKLKGIQETIKDHFPLYELDEGTYMHGYYLKLVEKRFIIKVSKHIYAFELYDYRTGQFKDTYVTVTNPAESDHWECCRECNEYAEKKMDDELDDNTPKCIHQLCVRLIEDHGNPTNIEIKQLSQDQLMWSDGGEVYWMDTPQRGQKLMTFIYVTNCGVVANIWLNNDGGIRCGRHNQNRARKYRRMKNGDLEDVGGCLCTKCVVEALHKRFPDEETYQSIRSLGEFQHQIPDYKPEEWRSDLLHSHTRVPIWKARRCPRLDELDSDHYKKYDEFQAPLTYARKDIRLCPEITECPCHHRYRFPDKFTKKGTIMKKVTATVYDLTRSYEVDLEVWTCPKCNRKHHMDGVYKKLFNWNDKKLFTHGLIIAMTTFLTEGRSRTTSGFVSYLNTVYSTGNSEMGIRPWRLLMYWSFCIQRFMWTEHLGCLMCDKNKENNYDALIFDGTAMILKQLYCDELYTPRISNKHVEDLVVKMSYSKSTRIISNAQIRKIIDQYVAGTFGRRKCDNKEEYAELSDTQRDEMDTFLNKQENKVLKEFLAYCENVFE